MLLCHIWTAPHVKLREQRRGLLVSVVQGWSWLQVSGFIWRHEGELWVRGVCFNEHVKLGVSGHLDGSRLALSLFPVPVLSRYNQLQVPVTNVTQWRLFSPPGGWGVIFFLLKQDIPQWVKICSPRRSQQSDRSIFKTWRFHVWA